jgi:hypothetical protein
MANINRKICIVNQNTATLKHRQKNAWSIGQGAESMGIALIELLGFVEFIGLLELIR